MNEKPYVLNVNSKKIHLRNGCYKSRDMKRENTAYYYTIEEAKAEYPHKVELCLHCFEKEGE